MPPSMEFARSLPGILMAGGVVLLTLLALMNLKSRLRRRRPNQTAREFIEQVRATTEPSNDRLDAGSLTSHVELEERAKQLIAQIDNRTAQLESLLRQADERLALLDESLYHAPGTSISPSKVRTHLEPHDSTPGDNGARPQPAIMTHSLPEGGLARGATEDLLPTNGAMSFEGDSRFPADSLSASVYELADRGRSIVEIAQYLDEQVGKIELILALRSHV